MTGVPTGLINFTDEVNQPIRHACPFRVGRIYLITNTINQKSYVGLTTMKVEQRWKEHLRCVKKGVNYPLYRSIQKYGKENFKIETLETAKIDDLKAREIYFIAELKTHVSLGGYNQTLGGDGVVGHTGWHHGEEAKKAISAGNSRKVRTPEVRQAIRTSVQAAMTDEVKKKISDRTKEALLSPEKRSKIVKGLKKVWSNPDMIERSRNLNTKVISQYTVDGVLVETYRSAREATRVTGINHGNICACARGIKRHAGGYVWKFS